MCCVSRVGTCSGHVTCVKFVVIGRQSGEQFGDSQLRALSDYATIVEAWTLQAFFFSNIFYLVLG